MIKCSSIGCGNKDGRYKIRTRALCAEHYIEAMEHGADLDFDLIKMIGISILLPPIKKKEEPLIKIHNINRDINKFNKCVDKKRREADIFYVRPKRSY